jgi:hypothetical protein
MAFAAGTHVVLGDYTANYRRQDPGRKVPAASDKPRTQNIGTIDKLRILLAELGDPAFYDEILAELRQLGACGPQSSAATLVAGEPISGQCDPLPEGTSCTRVAAVISMRREGTESIRVTLAGAKGVLLDEQPDSAAAISAVAAQAQEKVRAASGGKAFVDDYVVTVHIRGPTLPNITLVRPLAVGTVRHVTENDNVPPAAAAVPAVQRHSQPIDPAHAPVQAEVAPEIDDEARLQQELGSLPDRNSVLRRARLMGLTQDELYRRRFDPTVKLVGMPDNAPSHERRAHTTLAQAHTRMHTGSIAHSVAHHVPLW